MTRLRMVAPLLVAATLAVVAVATARTAGCDEPGRYEASAEGYVLVGGCVAPGDFVLPDLPPPPPAASGVDTDTPTKG